MSAGDKGLIRRNLNVDRARHPLLYRWMLENPYYWSEAARDLLETELAAGRVPINLQGAAARANPKRPRGVHAAKAKRQQAETAQPAPVVQGPDSGTQADTPSSPSRAEPPQATMPSAQKANKSPSENTYATEPAQQNAEPVESEPSQPLSERERLRKIAEQTLLSNNF